MSTVACAVTLACASHWTGQPPGYSAASTEARTAEDAGTAGEDAAAPRPAPPESVATREVGSEEPPQPAPFPEGTRSLRVLDQAHVRSAPDDHSRYIGKITRGTRVAWKRVVAAADDARPARGKPPRCSTWVEIEPMGFLCEKLLAPAKEEPSGDHLPLVPHGKLIPFDYFRINENETNVYKTAEDVRGGIVEKQLSTKVMVVGSGIVDVDGTEYTKTDHGLVETARLGRYWPSDFAGLDVRGRAATDWPFAWVYAPRGARKPAVLSAPDEQAPVVRRAERREVVRVLEEQNGHVRIGDGEWIPRKQLRVAALSPLPAGLAEGARWIDVDRDEQVLVAYEGAHPVFATLVSTGKLHHETPLGLYRVRAKAATTSMAGDPDVPDRYEVSAVPWAVRFRSGLFIHGVYWHDGFGGILSHGCVNVSPKDAAFIFEWVDPKVPDGWSEIEVPPNEGVFVRVRDREHPDPLPFDYTKEDAKQ
ncbi:MAG TPA: L,D-transpeptidase [Polyangiaceae bacterium]|nr:L,D-transpeptidase [Polyangiaceae bacterium]